MGLVVTLVIGVVLGPRVIPTTHAVPDHFSPHGLQGATPQQLKDYATEYIYQNQLGTFESIPFAKITSLHELYAAGLTGGADEDAQFAVVILKGSRATHASKSYPYQLLGFDVVTGQPVMSGATPDGQGFGQLVGDPSVRPSAPCPHCNPVPIAPDGCRGFSSHSLHGASEQDLRDYVTRYIIQYGIGHIDSIPYAQITTLHAVHAAGLSAVPDSPVQYAMVILKGNFTNPEAHRRPDEPWSVPWLLLGFDLDHGVASYMAISPDGAGFGALVNDPSLPRASLTTASRSIDQSKPNWWWCPA